MMLNSLNDMNDYDFFSLSDFDKVISKFNLKPDFTLHKEDGKIIVNEVWTHPRVKITANRIYEFDIYFLDLVPDEIKENLLKYILDIYVEDERYEEAAEIRDEIKNLV